MKSDKYSFRSISTVFRQQVLKLYQKCQSIRSNRIQIFDKNSKTILVDDRKCGVLNNSQVEHSNICFSSVQTQNISK